MQKSLKIISHMRFKAFELLKKFKKFIIAYLIYKLLFICALLYIYHESSIRQHGTEEKVIIIPKHDSIKQVSSLLYENSLIKNRLIFIIIAKILTLDSKYIKAGEYKFDTPMTMIEVIKKLLKGDVVKHKATIPEGLTNSQVFQLLRYMYGLEGDIDESRYSEGHLLPETYMYIYGDTRQSILDRMNASLNKEIDLLLISYQLPEPLKTPQQLLTLASIVEKETKVPSERPRVARVYLNRLMNGMLLQADPTVAYGIFLQTGSLPKKLTYQDLALDSPYNTYKHPGLPPTPIANPGINSIKAVLNPAQTDEIFFVADPINGGHRFSVSYKEHVKNVAYARSYAASSNTQKSLK